jgi:hypothetical protein
VVIGNEIATHCGSQSYQSGINAITLLWCESIVDTNFNIELRLHEFEDV